MHQRYHALVRVISDQLGRCAGRTATCPARASCSTERGTATDPAPEVLRATQQRPRYFDLVVADLSAEASEQVPLVEEAPTMMSAGSRRLPAIAVPGADGWRTALASPFAGWRPVVVIDCDEQGRAAVAITKDLKRVSLARALDLAPDRDHGYDLMEQLARGEPPEIQWS